MQRPHVTLTDEMIRAAEALVPKVKVARTPTSPVDTLSGALGEFAFSEWFTGSWENHEVGSNKGKADFRGLVEVKTSVYPFKESLNLVIREDYGWKFKPLYVQVIIDVANKRIGAGNSAIICGFATHEQATAKPAARMQTRSGPTPYKAFTTPISQLSRMSDFQAAYQAAAEAFL